MNDVVIRSGWSLEKLKKHLYRTIVSSVDGYTLDNLKKEWMRFYSTDLNEVLEKVCGAPVDVKTFIIENLTDVVIDGDTFRAIPVDEIKHIVGEMHKSMLINQAVNKSFGASSCKPEIMGSSSFDLSTNRTSCWESATGQYSVQALFSKKATVEPSLDPICPEEAYFASLSIDESMLRGPSTLKNPDVINDYATFINADYATFSDDNCSNTPEISVLCEEEPATCQPVLKVVNPAPKDRKERPTVLVRRYQMVLDHNNRMKQSCFRMSKDYQANCAKIAKLQEDIDFAESEIHTLNMRLDELERKYAMYTS